MPLGTWDVRVNLGDAGRRRSEKVFRANEIAGKPIWRVGRGTFVVAGVPAVRQHRARSAARSAPSSANI